MKNKTCNSQKNLYANIAMSLAKKQSLISQSDFNTFFNLMNKVYRTKVINFALYQQSVNTKIKTAYYQEITTKTSVDKLLISPDRTLITY